MLIRIWELPGLPPQGQPEARAALSQGCIPGPVGTKLPRWGQCPVAGTPGGSACSPRAASPLRARPSKTRVNTTPVTEADSNTGFRWCLHASRGAGAGRRTTAETGASQAAKRRPGRSSRLASWQPLPGGDLAGTRARQGLNSGAEAPAASHASQAVGTGRLFPQR